MNVGGYGALLRARGVPRLAAAFLALGVANTMVPVAFVLFARAATHSFATASLVLAASTAGGLLFGPARGRLVDRAGPRDAVLLLAIPDIATDVAFIAGGRGHAGAGVLVLLAFVAGSVTAPAGSALRTVWSETLAEPEGRQAGYAVMTMLQETTFIAGPLLAGALIAVWSPTAAVAATAVLSFVGALAFALPQAARREPKPVRSGRLPALAGGGIRTVIATAAAFGLTFGVLDVAFPAFARAHGSAATAGVLLSTFALGSWAGGFLYGLQRHSAAAGERYPVLCLLAATGLAPLIATPSLPVMIVLALVSGLCFAPITTCQLAVIDEVAQPEHKAEAFSWLGTLYGTGLALGAALAGQLINLGGPRAALGAACGAAVLAWLFASARATTLRPTRPATDAAPQQSLSLGVVEGPEDELPTPR
jgi:MFS family permease